MEILPATSMNAKDWNHFVENNYPPVGAFMQTFEWGTFQKDLGRKISRQVVMDGKKILAIFTLVEFKLRLGLSYGYIPRGPVIAKGSSVEKTSALFETIRKWSKEKFPHLIFLRLEPPTLFSETFRQPGFSFPSHYIQPRYNAVVDLTRSEEEILTSFHSSTRSNIKRAEKRGVTVTIKKTLTDEDYTAFTEMMHDTILRNSGKNAYPGDVYFRYFLKTVPYTAYFGYHEGELASAHFVLFVGKTATYIYGASHTSHLNSKVDTYLHWTAMKDARKKHCEYYDLGGIDPKRWPSLTTYKRQYHGKEFEYLGNIDIPFRPFHYRIYSGARNIKVWLSKITSKK